MRIFFNVLMGALALAPVLYLAAAYPDLPERVPVHWNAAGVADRFAHKAIGAVFLPSVLGIGVQLLLGMMAWDLRAAMGMEENEWGRKTVAANLYLMEAIRGLTAVLFCVLAVMVPLSARGENPAWARNLLMGLGVAIFVGAITGAIRVYLLQSKWEESETTAPDWTAGVFYYNAADPRLFVRKRIGVGLTFNFAHPRAKLYGVVIAGILVVTLLAVIIPV